MTTDGIVFDERPNLPPRWNIAPAQSAPVVVEQGDGFSIRPMRWGLHPSWKKEPPEGKAIINARSETAHEKPFFRAALQRRRGVAPASAYYEWKAGPTPKQPCEIRDADGGMLWLAALWELWETDKGAIESFSLLTTEPNADTRAIHHRMPVLLETAKARRAWLNSDTPEAVYRAFFKPARDGALVVRSVSKSLNAVSAEGEALAETLYDTEKDEPPAPPKQAKQGDLFG